MQIERHVTVQYIVRVLFVTLLRLCTARGPVNEVEGSEHTSSGAESASRQGRSTSSKQGAALLTIPHRYAPARLAEFPSTRNSE